MAQRKEDMYRIFKTNLNTEREIRHMAETTQRLVGCAQASVVDNRVDVWTEKNVNALDKGWHKILPGMCFEVYTYAMDFVSSENMSFLPNTQKTQTRWP